MSLDLNWTSVGVERTWFLLFGNCFYIPQVILLSKILKLLLYLEDSELHELLSLSHFHFLWYKFHAVLAGEHVCSQKLLFFILLFQKSKFC